jgi:hypothetical protein
MAAEKHPQAIDAAAARFMVRRLARSRTPMPLSFSAEEMDLLLELSRPIEPAQRSAFLDAVAAAIGEQASGPGLVHVTARRIQRDFWTPPQLSPNTSALVHRGRAA